MDSNISSNVLLRSGFVVEGTLRKANWADGKWEDIYEMGVLEEEWAAKHWKDELELSE